MAGGSVNIGGVLPGTTAGTQYIGPYTLVPNTASNFAVTEVTLASGANTITVPSWALMCLIVPPTANSQTLTLKGVTGDTGIAISETLPSLLSFTTAPASFVITAGGATTNPTSFIFS
jgi:hypothetical protein